MWKNWHVPLLKLPLSYVWLFRKSIRDDANSILDIGCWDGEIFKLINRKYNYSLGTDIVKVPLITNYDNFVVCSATHLPFKDKSFDASFSCHVIEHLEKDDGYKMIAEMERVAKKQVIISTPTGFIDAPKIEFEMIYDAHMKHLSGWEPKELREMGYKVVGNSWKALQMESTFKSEKLKLLRNAISYLLAPYFYFNPEKSAQMICTKNLDAKKK